MADGKDDIAEVLSQPEGQYFERKSLWHGPLDARGVRKRREVRDEIAQYVAALANADGGLLVLGVEDDGTPTGHGDPPDVVDEMLTVPRHRLVPACAAGRRHVVDGQELLVFDVPAAERAVMVRGDGFPRRVDDTLVQESEEAINAIKARGRSESIESDPVPGSTVADLDPELLARAQRGAGLNERSSTDYLCERRLADRRGSDLVLRRGAVLLFAARPRVIDHPNAGVRIFRVSGTERLTGTRHNVEELPRIEGALPLVIEGAYEAIGRLIRKSTRLHDLFFREMPEYPTFAWQEALVNAVAHRDYRVQSRSIEVWLYEDRMEVISPGGLLPEIDLATIRRREQVHGSRNPRMSRVLAELSLMREQGEGIPRVFEEMERSWLQMPEFRADGHSFTVVLRNEPILQTPEPHWVEFVRELPISHRQRRILVANPRGAFGNGDYQKLNDVDRDTAYREIKNLVDLGLVTASGRGRGARYAIDRAAIVGGSRQLRPRDVLAARMHDRGYLQNADYRDAFDTDRHAALAALNRLVDQGVLHREGQRRGTRYGPGPRWERWLKESQRPA